MYNICYIHPNTVTFLNFSKKRLVKQLHMDNQGMKVYFQINGCHTVSSKLLFPVNDCVQCGPIQSQIWILKLTHSNSTLKNSSVFILEHSCRGIQIWIQRCPAGLSSRAKALPNSILTFFQLTGISGFPATDSKTQKIEKIILVQILDSDLLRVSISTVLLSSTVLT